MHERFTNNPVVKGGARPELSGDDPEGGREDMGCERGTRDGMGPTELSGTYRKSKMSRTMIATRFRNVLALSVQNVPGTAGNAPRDADRSERSGNAF